MPSLSPTSSFEQPSAISTTTCTWRSVSVKSPLLRFLVMWATLRGTSAADPVRPQHLEHLGDLFAPRRAALLADVDRDAETRLPRTVDHRQHLSIVVPGASRPRPRDVDADDAARRPADRLLDDDLVLPGGERPIHHQDQAGADLRILEAGTIEPPDRREDDVVEIAFA